MVWRSAQSFQSYHIDNNTIKPAAAATVSQNDHSKKIKMMKFTSNFLRLWLLIVLIALFSRVEVVQSLQNSNDSKHGYCSILDLKRSVLLVKHDVQKKSAGMFRMFRKKSWSVRFPEVSHFVFAIFFLYFQFLSLSYVNPKNTKKTIH